MSALTMEQAPIAPDSAAHFREMSDAWDAMAAAATKFDGSYERARDRLWALLRDGARMLEAVE